MIAIRLKERKFTLIFKWRSRCRRVVESFSPFYQPLADVINIDPHNTGRKTTITTTTTSLFKIKYSLQSLCPQLAKAV